MLEANFYLVGASCFWHAANSQWCVPATQVGYIDDPRGPIGLAGVVVLALTAILILEVLDFVNALKARP